MSPVGKGGRKQQRYAIAGIPEFFRKTPAKVFENARFTAREQSDCLHRNALRRRCGSAFEAPAEGSCEPQRQFRIASQQFLETGPGDANQQGIPSRPDARGARLAEQQGHLAHRIAAVQHIDRGAVVAARAEHFHAAVNHHIETIRRFPFADYDLAPLNWDHFGECRDP